MSLPCQQISGLIGLKSTSICLPANQIHYHSACFSLSPVVSVPENISLVWEATWASLWGRSYLYGASSLLHLMLTCYKTFLYLKFANLPQGSISASNLKEGLFYLVAIYFISELPCHLKSFQSDHFDLKNKNKTSSWGSCSANTTCTYTASAHGAQADVLCHDPKPYSVPGRFLKRRGKPKEHYIVMLAGKSELQR